MQEILHASAEIQNQTGATLRARWQAEANSHPLTLPLMAHAMRCWRLHWPDGATAGALIYDVAALSRHLTNLERRIDQIEGARHE